MNRLTRIFLGKTDINNVSFHINRVAIASNFQNFPHNKHHISTKYLSFDMVFSETNYGIK